MAIQYNIYLVLYFSQLLIVPEKCIIVKRVVPTKLYAGYTILRRFSHGACSGKTDGKKSEIFSSNYLILAY